MYSTAYCRFIVIVRIFDTFGGDICLVFRFFHDNNRLLYSLYQESVIEMTSKLSYEAWQTLLLLFMLKHDVWQHNQDNKLQFLFK